MKRREFITFLGGAAASSSLWPLTARGQQSVMPVIGFLGVTSAAEWEKYVAGFRDGLKEAGFVDGRNVTIDYEWAEGHYDRLPAMAAAFAKRPVDVIVPIAPPAVRAAKAATTTIPIVFFLGSDPVELKIVTNLSHPEGNITGATSLANALGAKRLELLREVVPNSAAYGMIVNPTNQNAVPDTSDVSKAAARLGTRLVVVKASKDGDINAAFRVFEQEKVSAVLVNPDPYLLSQRKQIAALATHDKIATIFHLREPVADGGLMSYGASFVDAHRIVGVYTGRVLKGAKPADLPIPQPTKFELAINLRTAKALGLTIPATLLATADEVIE